MVLASILATGFGGALLLGILTEQGDLAVMGALLGGLLGYSLALGRRISRLEQQFRRGSTPRLDTGKASAEMDQSGRRGTAVFLRLTSTPSR